MATVINVVSKAETLIRMGGEITAYTYHVWCSMHVADESYSYERKYHIGDEYWQFQFDHEEDAVAFTLRFTPYVLKEEWFEL